jgi:probable HAF family extracellular repeat protein
MKHPMRPAHLSRRTFTLCAAGAAASLTRVAQAQPTQGNVLYDPKDLGYLPGYGGIKAIAINQRGQVVGNVDNSVLMANEAFVWTAGGTAGPPENPEMRPLGNLSGRPDWLFNGSMATDINHNGQVVGCADGTGRPVDSTHACLWQPNGKAVDLGTFLGGAMDSMATSINNIGQVVGWSDTAYGTLDWFKHRHAFRYQISTRQLIDLGVDHSEANSINDWNEIVGSYYNDRKEQHACYWDSNGHAWDLHSRVTAGGSWSKASAINDRGQVVGWAADPGDQGHCGFCYDLRTGVVKHASVTPIYGRQSSRIYGINNRGQAVGTYRADVINYHALLWNLETGQWEDLNNRLVPEQRWPKAEWPHKLSGWLLMEAWDINDMGQVVASGTHSIEGNYQTRACRMNPRDM